MTFAVIFEPELPDCVPVAPPSNVNWTVASDAADGQPDYDLKYVIGGKVFGYYPASLDTLLGDLLGEIDALRQGVAHNVSMSGYTILLADLVGDNVTFRDPWPGAETVWAVPVADVRAALENASAKLWGHLKASRASTA